MTNVSRETSNRLQTYAEMLALWTKKINLIAPSTVADIATRHIADSQQIYPLAPKGWKTWVDIGSGGGLPGIVVAILAKEEEYACDVTMIESDARKCAFLRAVLRETGVSAKIIQGRVESTPPAKADVLSARALAPLPKLLEYGALHLAEGGTALFMKGRRADEEIEQALEGWTFACEKHSSATDPEGAILQIGEIARV